MEIQNQYNQQSNKSKSKQTGGKQERHIFKRLVKNDKKPQKKCSTAAHFQLKNHSVDSEVFDC